MSLSMHIAPNTQSARIEIRNTLAACNRADGEVVFLAPSQVAVAQYLKLWAKESFSFGLKVTTLDAWVADRWELYGDGRHLVAPLQRKLLIHKTLAGLSAQTQLKYLALTPGTVSLLAEIAAESLPYFLDDFTSATAQPLTEVELEVCAVLKEYAQILPTHGLCEQVQAMFCLAESNWKVPRLFVELSDRQSFAEKHFFEDLGKRTEVTLYFDEMSLPITASEQTCKEQGGTDGQVLRSKELIDIQARLFNPKPDNPVEPSGTLRFLLPAGHYAEALLLAESIARYSHEGNRSIAVATKHPFDLFEHIAPYLQKRGIGLRVADRSRFAASDFGKLWLNLLRFLDAETFSTFQLSDVVLSPFSDLPKHRAFELDALWRGNRACTRQDCLADLASVSSLFGRVLIYLENLELEQALDAFEEVARAKFMWSEAYRTQQLSVIDCARACLGFAKDFGLEFSDVSPYLEAAPLSVTVKTFDNPSMQRSFVDLMSLDALAEQEPCSYEVVIITDLDTASYPVKDESNAADQLLEKRGVLKKENSLEHARRRFFRALSVPLKSLVCERVLNTVDAGSVYPSVMLEELLDCYRSDLLTNDEIDKTTGLPNSLKLYAQMAGEDKLYQNLAVEDTPQIIEGRGAISPQGKVTEAARAKIVLPNSQFVKGDQGKSVNKKALSLSPSAIESYLECPYKWFSLRRLRLDTPDAGFGSLEMGSFAHRLLKAFYENFQKLGFVKVTKDNLESAKKLLDELFDQHLAFQRELKQRENPLIALSPLERAEVDSFRKRLLRYLDREALLLPHFIPRYFEYDFGKEGSLSYAGALLHGTVDRIDVNDKGQAVVIDYKGALSADYAYHSKSELPWATCLESEKSLALPHKVQALLYAQAIRRELGLDVVAALYVSYGRDAKISGAFDHRFLGTKDLPGIDGEACIIAEAENEANDAGEHDILSGNTDAAASYTSIFSGTLDNVEASIAYALDKLQEGYIEPFPRGKDPCGYCPVTACLARRAAK